MPADESRVDRDNERDKNRHSTFLHESDFPSEDRTGPEAMTQRPQMDGPDTVSYGDDSLIGETVTLNGDGDNVLGNFRLVSKLGSGGFGTVYKAEDLRLDRFVAIKAALLRPADRGDQQNKRVFHEGRAAAALDHPNIVSIYDVAELNGTPYIVSQLIDGVTLKEWKSSGRVTLKQIIEVLILVARAVDYAHGKGVVHRDLKPGNILMGVDGVPYVNDFGIAKHSDAEETISHESSIIGTPAYMSPEQAAGHSRDADRRSDLYSLGVILYELATGEKPFRGHSRMLIHHVIHTDPQPLRMLDQTVPRDLETICLKCLEKDPERRYQTCSAFADELQRFLAGEPIEAHPISSLQHFVRRCRRYPATTTITGSLIAAIVIGLIGVTWQWRRAESNRLREVAAREEVEHSRQKLADKVAYSNQMLHDAESKLAFSSMLAGDHRHAKQALEQLAPLGDVEYHLLKTIEDRYSELFRHVELVRDVAISDDEQFIAAAGLRTLLVWETGTGQIVHRFRQKGQQLRCVDFQPGGHLLAWGGQDGRVRMKPIGSTGERVRSFAHGAPINAIRFSSDGGKILAAGEKGVITVWSVKDNGKLAAHQVSSAEINAADFIEDDTLISGDAEGFVMTCDIETGDLHKLFRHESSVLSIDVSDDSTQFAAGSRNSRIAIGRIDDPDSIDETYSRYGPIVDVEFWGKKKALVTTSLFGRLAIRPLPLAGVSESGLYFQGAGHFTVPEKSDRLLIGGGDGVIVAMGVDEVQPDVIRTSAAVRDLLYSGSSIVVCHESRPASIFHRKTGKLLRTIPDESRQDVPTSMTCVDQSDGGSKLVFGTDDGRILVWNAESGKIRVHGQPTGKSISKIQLTDDAMAALSGGSDGSVRHWDLSKANSSEGLAALGGVIRGLKLSGDDRHALAVAANGIAILIDVKANNVIQRIDLKQPLNSVAWSHDSARVAIGGNRGSVYLFPGDLVGDPIQIEAHNGPVGDVLFSPSGNRIISVGNDHQVTFSNLVTGRSGATLEGIHPSDIRNLAISEDGRWLATADVGGTIRIWRVSGDE